MVVRHAVDLTIFVHCEGNLIQTLCANTASKTTWVVGFAQGLEDSLGYYVTASFALFRRALEPAVKIVILAVNFVVVLVEYFITERATAAATHETVIVIDAAQGLTG